MNYKALKKVIKAQAARRTTARGGGGGGSAGGAGSGAASGGAGDVELPFLHYVDREVEKVKENE